MAIKPSKFYVIKRIEEMIKEKPVASLLDLGSGSSENFLKIVTKYPDLSYTGIEPDGAAAGNASRNFNGLANAEIINGFAGERNGKLKGRFDLVVSLSVLEHVKKLKDFLVFSAQCLKKGGRLIHLYDLGHYFSPSGAKERLQVFLSRYFPLVVPENKFCSYVKKDDVIKILLSQGIKIIDVTYHNMPENVALLKRLNSSQAGLAVERISESEVQSARSSACKDLEKRFRSICIWGERT